METHKTTRMLPYHHFPSIIILMVAMFFFLRSGECFTPPVSYLIDCGSVGNSSIDGRQWQSDDSNSPFVSTNHHILVRATNDTLLPLPEGELLRTARIFTEESSYTFSQIPTQSRLWLRLYFYPFGFEGFDPWKARFSVIVNDQFLLSINTSTAEQMAPSSSLSSSLHYVYREYSIRMGMSLSELEVIFRPEMGAGVYALINAIVVMSMPEGAIADSAVPLGGGTGAVTIDFTEKETAMVIAECIYRVNVGGPLITGANDTLGRMWEANDMGLISAAGSQPVAGDPSGVHYTQLAPRYIAPPIVLSTAIAMALPPGMVADPIYNLTWVFPAQPFFPYLIRLLFCELVYLSPGQRVFDVFVQNRTVFNGLDIVEQATASDTIFFHDIYLNSSDSASIWVQIGSSLINVGTDNRQGILNGLEIWKLSDLNLDSATKPVTRASVWGIFGIAMSALAAISALILLVFCFFYHHEPKTKPTKTTKLTNPAKIMVASIEKKAAASMRGIGGWFGSPLVGSYGVSTSIGSKVSTAGGSYASSVAPQPPNSLGRCFALAEIREATNNFDESLLLGVGGFGKVYKGEMDDGSIKVAVKRGNPRSEQGMTEFLTEIEMLSKLRHRHLVSLIGYCEEQQEMILVYEYMANGPLRAHLYGCSTELTLLSWKKRLEICIGAARGLHYLHTGGAAQGIIHRDVKTTNILLDDNFVAKVSDFGLSKTGPTLDRTHVSTAVKGSFGYLDPEYFRRQQLTEKSDVYSFGVVLMEVLCARPAINPALPRDQVNIAEWAMMWQKRGCLNEIVDPRLMPGTVHPESLKKFGETAEKCLADHGVDRPTMGDVLWNLEYTLQLQETAMAVRKMEEECESKTSLELPIQVLTSKEEGCSGPLETATSASHTTTILSSPSNNEECDAHELSTSQVFSQLIKPQGR